MNDIDRAVEIATLRMFLEYTEHRTYTPEPEPERCPGCGDSVDHPHWVGLYADNVRFVGMPHMGWHNACAEAIESERDAVLAGLPRFAVERAEVVNG